MPYVALPVSFWVLGLMELRRTANQDGSPAILRIAWPLLAGMLLPVSATVAYLAMQGALGVAWRTFTVYPGEAAGQVGIEPQRLVESSIWFVRTFGVLLILAFIGTWDRVRRAGSAHSGTDRLAGRRSSVDLVAGDRVVAVPL